MQQMYLVHYDLNIPFKESVRWLVWGGAPILSSLQVSEWNVWITVDRMPISSSGKSLKEIVYSSGGRVTFVEQLKHRIEYGFHSLKTMCNIGANLDRNVEIRVRCCWNSEKERKKRKNERKTWNNGGSGISTYDNRCYFLRIWV